MRKLSLSAILSVLLLAAGATVANANPISILLATGDSFTDVQPQLQSLGYSVTVSNPTTWGSGFNYSPYNVVAFPYGTSNPADIGHLIAAVDSGNLGVVFFRGYGAETTAASLGLISTSVGYQLQFQTPTSLNVLNTSNYITSNLTPGTYNLGYDYMAYVYSPGADTSTLATGPDGAALVISDTLRAVITPYYGHPSGAGNETPVGFQITERSIAWAAGMDTVSAPEPATIALFGTALLGLGLARGRRRSI